MDIPGLAELSASNPAVAARLRVHVHRLDARLQALEWAQGRLGRLASPRTRGELLLALVDEVRALTGAEDAWAGTWQGRLDDGSLSFAALASAGGTVPGPLEVSRSIVAEAMSGGVPVWTDDALADARFGGAPSVRATGDRAVGCVPLGTAGILYLRDARRPFTVAVQLRVEALAQLAGAFLGEEPVAAPALAIPGLLGESRPMRELAAAIRSFARMPWPALILGETGTGKEAVARALHALGPRAGEPFLAINCGAVPDELAESLLFGHERGAFTGAERRREGLMERVAGGTLFLDEVGEAPPRLQVKLLRLLQEGSYERVGGTETLRFKGRVVAATWRAIGETGSSFRTDLYHRLGAGVLRVPPLRERRDDVPALARFLLDRALAELPDAPRLCVADAALGELATRDWPGNVRELDNALKVAIAHALAWGDDTLRPAHFDNEPGTAPSSPAQGLLAATENFQRQLVRQALDACGQNRSEAADQLGVSRQWLHRLLSRWGGAAVARGGAGVTIPPERRQFGNYAPGNETGAACRGVLAHRPADRLVNNRRCLVRHPPAPRAASPFARHAPALVSSTGG